MERDSDPPRNSNLKLCYTCIAFGVFCILLTIAAALALKNGIIERVRETPRIDALSDGFKIESINRDIERTERDIEFQKKVLPDDPEAERRKMEETFRKSNLKFDVNRRLPFSDENKAEKLKMLEEKRRQLIADRDDLIGKSRAKAMKPRTWDEFFDDYGIELLLGVIPLGLLSLYFARLTFGGRMPASNPLSLTDFESKSILFIPFALVFSAFGFFLFVWILALIY